MHATTDHDTARSVVPAAEGETAAMDQVRVGPSGAQVAIGGRWVTVHSTRDPMREARATVAAVVEGEGANVLIAIGLGLGYIIDALDEVGWTGRVLALEPEPALVPHLLARPAPRAWVERGRLKILTAPDFTGATMLQVWVGSSRTPGVPIVNAPLARARAEGVAEALRVVQRLQALVSGGREALRRLGPRYLLNTLRNLGAIAGEGDVSDLFDGARGVPAVVVGAGPSLDRSLAALRNLSGRALVIATDTASRPLLTAGIEPDLVVSVDPGEATVRHLWDLPPCPGTSLVAEASVHPDALRGFAGRTFLVGLGNEPWPWLARQGAGRSSLGVLGTVLTCTFDLAVRMGCDPIVFMGADLAYTDGRPYCRGVAYEEEWRRLADWGTSLDQQWKGQIEERQTHEAPDIHGRPTRTTVVFTATRSWIVDRVAEVSEIGGRRVLNATGGGILAGPGIDPVAPEAAMDALRACPAKPDGLVRSRYRPNRHRGVLQAARALVRRPDRIPEAWMASAEGLTTRQIVDALRRGTMQPDPKVSIDGPCAQRAIAAFDAWWGERLAAEVPLVGMPIRCERMERHGDYRRFRFRTTGARLIGCMLRLPDGALREDGAPLRQADAVEAIGHGEYAVWRDEVYFRASDATDPRDNGRTYTLSVPAVVAYLEALSHAEIVERRL